MAFLLLLQWRWAEIHQNSYKMGCYPDIISIRDFLMTHSLSSASNFGGHLQEYLRLLKLK